MNNNDTQWLETVKNLVAEKDQLQAPSVTCGSSAERQWWPPYTVNDRKQNEE